MVHELTTTAGLLAEIACGARRHEIRKSDPRFTVGDVLRLHVLDPDGGQCTAREILVRITHITPGGESGLPQGLCVMSVELTQG